MISTVPELLAAARRHGLSLTTEQQDFDRTGLDFLVVHGEDEEGTRWIARTPRRDDVFEAARVEAGALALVRGRLPVAVPEWRVFSRDVIAYPRLDGTPAVTVDPEKGPEWHVIAPGALPDAFVESFAAAIAALQAIDPDQAQRGGVPVVSIDDARAALSRAMSETRSVLSPPETLWARWQRWIEDDATWPSHLALSHGDLHPGHMLLSDDARLTGILDWTEVKVSDPSIDLAMYGGCFGREALEALVTRLEALGMRSWPRAVDHAMERWAVFPVLGAEWALRTGNEAVLEHARAHMAMH